MKTHVYKLVLGFVLTLLLNINSNAQDYEYIPMVTSLTNIWNTFNQLFHSDNILSNNNSFLFEDKLIN